MTKFQSIYFDFIRFLAACLVVHSHLLEHELLPLWLSGSKEFGREAVIIFFVMSGYVIAFTTEEKKHNWQDYFIARASRIYSVALPIILLAAVIAVVGINVAPEKYQDFYQYDKLFFYIPFHLLFLGEMSVFYEKPFLVVPYWSLSYEVWYYILFGCWFFLKGRFKYVLLSLVILVLGFRLLLLAPVWCAGVVIFNGRKNLKIPKSWSIFSLIASFILFFIYTYSPFPEALREYAISFWPSDWPALGSAERFLSDYVYTLIIGLNFIAAASIDWDIKRFKKTMSAVRALASYTFTLYLSHMLIIEPVIRHVDNYQHDAYISFLTVLSICGSTWLLGMITEKRKFVFVQLFQRLFVLARLTPIDKRFE